MAEEQVYQLSRLTCHSSTVVRKMIVYALMSYLRLYMSSTSVR